MQNLTDIDGIELESCYKIMSYWFIKTCDACPEQYDVIKDDKIVAYVRLRWGRFSVRCPGFDGDLIYKIEFNEGFKGCFDGDAERHKFLKLAVDSIREYYRQKKAERLESA